MDFTNYLRINCAAISADSDGRLCFSDGSERQATYQEIADAKRLMWRDDVYQNAAKLLDAQSVGYSPVEIATWPELQFDILHYNSYLAIGPTMQSVLNRGRHTAETLSALLTPKIAYQTAVLQARDNHISAIDSLPADTQDYDVTTGWPS